MSQLPFALVSYWWRSYTPAMF